MSINNKAVQKPKQVISTRKKLGKSEKARAWREDCVNYFGNKSSVLSSVKGEFERLYKLASGYLDESQYEYLTNPYNLNSSRKQHVVLRNYDIISPIIQMYLGEKSKRKSDPIVVAVNSDITTIKEQKAKELVNQELQQMFVNNINGFADTGFISRDLKGYEQIQTEVDSIKDDKAITGQQSLNYILEEQEIKRKLRKGFYDMICTSHVYSHKDVLFDNIVYDTYSPVNCGYVASENKEFIEDGESAWVRKYMTLSDILDEFHEELTKEEIEDIENLGNNSRFRLTDTPSSDSSELVSHLVRTGKLGRLNFDTTMHRSDMYEVLYVNWKSKTKIGKLKGIDGFGNPYEVEVDEDFPVRDNETIEWYWVNQTWEGTRIGDRIYKRIRPIPFQRGTIDNPSDCKLLINGRNLLSRHFYTKSPVKKLEAFQERYNAIHWHIEKVMNKNKDKITLLPRNLIGKLGIEKSLYFADMHGFLFTDEIDVKTADNFRAVQVLDMSLRDYLQYLYNALSFVRQEAEETLGITRARKGQTFASEGKGVTEQSIFQSAIISEEIFLEYEEFEKREYQGLLDLSKFAWRNGKKANFVDSEKRIALLNVLGADHRETEYSVSVQNGNEEHQKLQELTDLKNVQAMIQNGTAPHIIAKMKQSKSIEEMIDILEIDHEKFMAQQEAVRQQEAGLENAKLEQQERIHQDEIDIKLYEIDSKILISQNNSVALDKNSENDLQSQTLQIEREKLNIKREEINSRERMNTQNNLTALKNKTVGEK